MFEKFEILIIIIIILLAFYFVITLGAGKGKDPRSATKITRYLFFIPYTWIIMSKLANKIWPGQNIDNYQIAGISFDVYLF